MKNNQIFTKIIFVFASLVLLLIFSIFILEKTRVIDIYQKPKNNPPELTPAEALSEKVKEVEDFKEKSIVDAPLPNSTGNEIIAENENFKITKVDNGYLVTIYSIINRPEQYQDYLKDLKESKQNAIKILISKGVDPSKEKITFEPNEASNL